MALTRNQIDDLAEEGVFLGNVYEIAQAIEAEVRKADDALIQQLVEALGYHRSQTRPIHQTNEAIIRGRARLQHLSEEKSKEQ